MQHRMQVMVNDVIGRVIFLVSTGLPWNCILVGVKCWNMVFIKEEGRPPLSS